MDPAVRKILSHFRKIEKAVIDASSMIYMERAGILELLGGVLKLFSPAEVIAESGINAEFIVPVSPNVKGDTNDDVLLAYARQKNLPLISEDKRMHLTAERAGVTCFNTLLMLNMLLFRKSINERRHAELFEALCAFGWYSPQAREFSLEVFRTVKSRER